MCTHKFVVIHKEVSEEHHSIMDTEYTIKWCELCGSYRNDVDSEDKYRRGTLNYPESVRLFDLAKMYEEIEAMMLNHEGYWFDKMPDEIYDKMMEAQKLRGELLYPEKENKE